VYRGNGARSENKEIGTYKTYKFHFGFKNR
jgi:hypothetical protein